MKKLDFEYTFKSISIQDIMNFEKKYNISLPENYTEFLLMNNGGKTKQRRFETKDSSKEGKIISSITLFYPLSKENEVNLEKMFVDYNLGQIVPNKLLPIGSDPADNLICLSIESEDKDSVYHCDLDYLEEDGELKTEYVRLISRNFKEFINSLYIPS